MDELKLTDQQIKDILYFYEGSENENEVITNAIKDNKLESLGQNGLKKLNIAIETEMLSFTNLEAEEGYITEFEFSLEVFLGI